MSVISRSLKTKPRLTVTIKPCSHHGERRLQLRFNYDSSLTDIIRAIPDARWSSTMQCWHIPDNNLQKEKLRAILEGTYRLIFSPCKVHKEQLQLSPEVRKALDDFEQYLVTRRYSQRTVDVYLHMVSRFFYFHEGKSPHQIT